MLDGLTPSQQMFMLFFSILYGIMLNALIGLGAFPIALFFARDDIVRLGWNDEPFYEKGTKSRNRFILSFFLLNVTPFMYFASVFIYIIPFTNPIPTFWEILSIALLSLSVFAFFQFFLACATCRRITEHIYTPFHFRRVINEKGFHPNPKYHILAGIFYLVVPWLVFLGVYFSNL